jgi:hypothetical protein
MDLLLFDVPTVSDGNAAGADATTAGIVSRSWRATLGDGLEIHW